MGLGMTERLITAEVEKQLDLFLDGLLEGEALRAFEEQLGRSPELREQVELQGRVDASMARWFPAQSVELPAVAGEVGSERSGLLKPLLIAASVLVAGAIGAYFLLFSTQQAPFDQPGEVYASIVDAGFEPRTVCTDEAAFIDWMERRFDQPLVVSSDAPGLELVGWDYKRIMTPRTGVLLARADGREVLVLVEHRENAVRLGDQEGLRVFRRDIGGVSLFEVTPLDEPRVLPLARTP